MKLVVEIEVQQYSGDEEEKAALEQIRQTVIAVVSLCDVSVGTFVKTDLQNDE